MNQETKNFISVIIKGLGISIVGVLFFSLLLWLIGFNVSKEETCKPMIASVFPIYK